MQAFFGEVTLPVNLSPFPLRIVTEDLTGVVAALTAPAAIAATSTTPNATTALRLLHLILLTWPDPKA